MRLRFKWVMILVTFTVGVLLVPVGLIYLEPDLDRTPTSEGDRPA